MEMDPRLKTNWYPKITLLRQENQGDWTCVINKIISILPQINMAE